MAPLSPPRHGACTSVVSEIDAMNVRLANFCLGLWALGLIGMGTARGVFQQEPGAPCFDAGTCLWVVGGLTYCFLGTLAFLDKSR